MSERWLSYARRNIQAAGGPMPFALGRWSYETPVMSVIRRLVPEGGRVLEVGCGSGALASLLSHYGFDVVGLDDDPDIVACAQEIASQLNAPARIAQGSAFDLSTYYDRFDLVYSLGVLEHFDAPVTVKLLEEQARCAAYVMIVVPSRFTKYSGPITDERIYNRRQVAALVRQAGLKPLSSFVYGSIPTTVSRAMDLLLPRAVNDIVRHLCTYAMGICCIGSRPDADECRQKRLRAKQGSELLYNESASPRQKSSSLPNRLPQ
jgi:SAM-dependent methyltransferase